VRLPAAVQPGAGGRSRLTDGDLSAIFSGYADLAGFTFFASHYSSDDLIIL